MTAGRVGIRIAACSERGTRRVNEDVLAHGEARAGHYAIVADGAGGHSRGAEAAQRAVACVERLLRDDGATFAPEHLTQVVRLAHAELARHQLGAEAQARMHCTVVVLWVDPAQRHVLWTHVGDSRLYRFRHGRADFQTRDDSVVQRLLQAGLISAEQVEQHPQKHQLVAALGIDGEVEPHTVVRPVELLPGDAFLLCTDGWWEGLDADFVAQALRHAPEPGQWLAQLRARVLELARPRQDNYSAVAVWFGDPGAAARPGDDETMPRALATSRG